MEKPEEKEVLKLTVVPSVDFYLCEPIHRDMFKTPGKLALTPTKIPTMPLSVSEVVKVWKSTGDKADAVPVHAVGDIVIHREEHQNTFRPDPRFPEFVFVHSTMILGKVEGLVKAKSKEE